MKKIGWILFLLGVLIFTGCKQTLDEVRSTEVDPIAVKLISNEPKSVEQRINSCACDEVTSRLVARAYVLSIPYMGRENELIPLMASNSSYFTAGGRAIQCMQSLGTTLWQRGSVSLEDADLAEERVRVNLGPVITDGTDILGEIGDRQRSNASEMMGMGQELLWLSQVLPHAVQGNYGPYNASTVNRQMANQRLSLICQLDPSTCQMMQSMLIEATPMMEQQIYVLAIAQSLEGNCQK